MLLLQKIQKTFGEKTVLSQINCHINQGEMVGIIGSSGAGKSTLLRIINRMIDPTSGAILWNNNDVARFKGSQLRSWRANCAMIFQHFNLIPRLDVLTNVLMGRLSYHSTLRTFFGAFTREERLKALSLLDDLGLGEVAFQQAGTLSGGQQQRVAIARALMQDPDIILADEPIASLDPQNAKIVMDTLKKINEEKGITILCNLHTLDTARHYCKRVLGMSKGQIIFDDAPHHLTGDMIGQIYNVGGRKENPVVIEAMTSTSIPHDLMQFVAA
jgi:phosphonate transport system ATP-binding protein